MQAIPYIIFALAMLAGCGDHASPAPVAGGDARTGKRLAAQYQCTACHRMPGAEGPHGNSGPALDKFGRASYIAGHVPNQPAALERWLMDPAAVKPGTLMPAMGVTPDDARHLAAYLYSLR